MSDADNYRKAAVNELALFAAQVGETEQDALDRVLERASMKHDYENDLVQIADILRLHGCGVEAAKVVDARNALIRRENALRNIKEAHSRWYDGYADAESTLRDIECFATGVWCQESIENDTIPSKPNNAICGTPSAESDCWAIESKGEKA